MELAIPVVIAMIVGWVIKTYVPNALIHNKFIPAILFVSQFIGRLALELGVSVAEAGAVGDLFKAAMPHVGDMLWQSVASTIGAVGIHSAVKNSKQSLPMFLGFLRLFAAKKIAGEPDVGQK